MNTETNLGLNSETEITDDSPSNTLTAGAFDDPLIIETPYGTVTVTDAVYNKSEPQLMVSYHYDDGTGIHHRNLDISGEDADIYYEVVSQGGELQFGVSVEYDPADTTTFTLTEWTATDRLSVRRTLVNDTVTEVYRANGKTFAATFTQEELDQWLNEDVSLSGTHPETELHENAGHDNPAWQFRSFYPEGWSLDDNVDGFILMAIIDTQEFFDWLSNGIPELGDALMREGNPDIDKVCALAVDAASLKCPIGNIANPVCVAAAGVLLACLIYYGYLLFS